jgi:hypothetical protein
MKVNTLLKDAIELATCTINVAGYKVEVEQDGYAESPRSAYDNLGTMWCLHNRYNLGDHESLPRRDLIDEAGSLRDYIIKNCDPAVLLPVFLYDHSGLCMNVSGFSCPWDSGQVGYIFISKQDARREFGVKRLSAKIVKRVTQYLINEVETYSQYLSGECYSYTVTGPNGEEVGNTCGFYGMNHEESGLLELVASDINAHIASQRRSRLALVKSLLKQRAPLSARQQRLDAFVCA